MYLEDVLRDVLGASERQVTKAGLERSYVPHYKGSITVTCLGLFGPSELGRREGCPTTGTSWHWSQFGSTAHIGTANGERGLGHARRIYLRVSTGRQAEYDLSIPDQGADRGPGRAAWWRVVAEFIEPGASATDDKRRISSA